MLYDVVCILEHNISISNVLELRQVSTLIWCNLLHIGGDLVAITAINLIAVQHLQCHNFFIIVRLKYFTIITLASDFLRNKNWNVLEFSVIFNTAYFELEMLQDFPENEVQQLNFLKNSINCPYLNPKKISDQILCKTFGRKPVWLSKPSQWSTSHRYRYIPYMTFLLKLYAIPILHYTVISSDTRNYQSLDINYCDNCYPITDH